MCVSACQTLDDDEECSCGEKYRGTEWLCDNGLINWFCQFIFIFVELKFLKPMEYSMEVNMRVSLLFFLQNSNSLSNILHSKTYNISFSSNST